MTPTTHQLKAAPLSFEKTLSTKAVHRVHIEQIHSSSDQITGKLNRKGQRMRDARARTLLRRKR